MWLCTADPSPTSETDYTLEEFVSEGVELMAPWDADPPCNSFDGTDAGLMWLAKWALTGWHPDTETQANIIYTEADPNSLKMKILHDFEEVKQEREEAVTCCRQ